MYLWFRWKWGVVICDTEDMRCYHKFSMCTVHTGSNCAQYSAIWHMTMIIRATQYAIQQWTIHSSSRVCCSAPAHDNTIRFTSIRRYFTRNSYSMYTHVQLKCSSHSIHARFTCNLRAIHIQFTHNSHLIYCIIKLFELSDHLIYRVIHFVRFIRSLDVSCCSICSVYQITRCIVLFNLFGTCSCVCELFN